MRKIGIVTEYFYPHLGGITEHVYYFSKELIRRGYDVVLLTGYEGIEDIPVPLPPSLRVLRLGRSIPIFSNHSFGKVTIGRNLGQRIRKVLEEEKFDLLHIQSPVMPMLPILFEKYSKTVTVGTLHTYFDSFGSLLYYRMFRNLIQRYLDKLDGLIAVSPSCIESMNRFFNADYRIIPNGIDTDWFANPKGFIDRYRDGSPNIFFLGRLDPRNGLDALLSALPLVLAKLPNARLIVAGDGPLRLFYEKRAGRLLGKSVFFEGQINEERPQYFATSSVFCYPANKASFGITLLEAMAAGRPVVATDNKGFREIIDHGVNGLLARPDDVASLADALVRVLTDAALSETLIRNGRATARKYSWVEVTDKILAFYNDIYAKTRGIPFAA